MLISRTFRGTVRGEAVRIVVLRNNGNAWGVVETPRGNQYDVDGKRDVYDEDDEDAARYFLTVARRNRLRERVEPVRPVTFEPSDEREMTNDRPRNRRSLRTGNRERRRADPGRDS